MDDPRCRYLHSTTLRAPRKFLNQNRAVPTLRDNLQPALLHQLVNLNGCIVTTCPYEVPVEEFDACLRVIRRHPVLPALFVRDAGSREVLSIKTLRTLMCEIMRLARSDILELERAWCCGCSRLTEETKDQGK